MKINQIIVFILIFISIQQVCHAQVGINQDNPSDSAILHISSDSKGVLFPAPVVDKINNNKKDGLFYYNSNEKRFYHYNKNLQSWQCVNPFRAQDTSNIITPGNLSVNNNLTIKKNLTVIGGKLTVKGGDIEVKNNHMLKGYGTTPIGGIIMWSGKISNIPDGWALCDGKKHNGRQTPDLRGRFIVGYSYSYNNSSKVTNDENYPQNAGSFQYYKRDCDTLILSGKINVNCSAWQKTDLKCFTSSPECKKEWEEGNYINDAVDDDYNQVGKLSGTKKHKLIVDELPSHKHKIDLTTGSDGKHKHKINYENGVAKGGGPYEIANSSASDILYSQSSGKHTHNVNGHTNNTGGASAHENRPPYYVLAFIMRIK
jgi:microcystin-dependent protein